MQRKIDSNHQDFRIFSLLSSLKVGAKGVFFSRIYSFIPIYKNFTAVQWENLFPFAKTPQEADLLFKPKNYLFAFTVSNHSGFPKGLFLIFVNNSDGQITATIHGGAWIHNLGSSRFYMNAYRFVCNSLFEIGVRVHTSTNKNLKHVLRFNKYAGFKVYRYTNNFILQRYYKLQPYL